MLSVNIRKLLGGRKTRAAGAGARGSDQRAGGFLLDVRFEAPPGVTILFGASGAGKSMTLKCVAGIARPDAGRVRVGGQVLFDSEAGVDLPARARGVGYVFLTLALFPHLTALGNVEFALSHLPRRERRNVALEALRNLGVRHAAGRRPREISGGEAQRVALARALASRPRLLLLDEPLSALDEPTKRAIISDLREMNRRLRLPVVYVMHGREEAAALGERVVVLERGRVVAAGEPLDVFGAPPSANVARLTGVENLFNCRVVRRHEAAGTMTVAVEPRAAGGEACSLEVPLGSQTEGGRVRVGVRAGDVLLAVEEPRGTSARNVLPGRVCSIEEARGRALVRVRSGVEWSVLVTREAVGDLKISEGLEVWLAVKTHSCHLLDED